MLLEVSVELHLLWQAYNAQEPAHGASAGSREEKNWVAHHSCQMKIKVCIYSSNVNPKDLIYLAMKASRFVCIKLYGLILVNK